VSAGVPAKGVHVSRTPKHSGRLLTGVVVGVASVVIGGANGVSAHEGPHTDDPALWLDPSHGPDHVIALGLVVAAVVGAAVSALVVARRSRRFDDGATR
jgi:hypothetical protein